LFRVHGDARHVPIEVLLIERYSALIGAQSATLDRAGWIASATCSSSDQVPEDRTRMKTVCRAILRPLASMSSTIDERL